MEGQVIEGRQADQAAFRKADPFVKARLIKLAAPRKPKPARPLVHQAPGIQSGSNSSALGAALVALTPNPQPLRTASFTGRFSSDLGLMGSASVEFTCVIGKSTRLDRNKFALISAMPRWNGSIRQRFSRC